MYEDEYECIIDDMSVQISYTSRTRSEYHSVAFASRWPVESQVPSGVARDDRVYLLSVEEEWGIPSEYRLAQVHLSDVDMEHIVRKWLKIRELSALSEGGKL